MTNLRTIVVFCELLFAGTNLLFSQPTICGFDALSQTDALRAPLSVIASELAFEITPAPYRCPELTQSALALGLPTYHSTGVLSVQGAPGYTSVSVGGRTQWQPRDDYLMAATAEVQWDAISFFPDRVGITIGTYARMMLTSWSIGAGLRNMMTLGLPFVPRFTLGVASQFDIGSASIDFETSWSQHPRLVIATHLLLADSLRAVVGIGTSPVTIDVGVRLRATETSDIAVNLRHTEFLGILPRLCICMRW